MSERLPTCVTRRPLFLLLAVLAVLFVALAAVASPRLVTWASGDSDGDGWDDVCEDWIGTDPYDACTDEPDDCDAWPPDFANGLTGCDKGDGYINVLDLMCWKNKVSYCDPDPGFNPRYDMNCDGCVNVLDVNIWGRYWGQSCIP